MPVLMRDFYLQDACAVAEKLLGKLLVHRTREGISAGMIVEAEAYAGPEDKGAHSYGGRRSARTEVMFGEGGHAYIYLIYGMYHCFNVVTNVAGKPEAVLIRALEPVEGAELMKKRLAERRASAGSSGSSFKEKTLCSGPGKLCVAMGLSKENYGQDLCGADSDNALYIEDFQSAGREAIFVSPRINIDYAEEYRDVLWRYYIKDNPCVSKASGKYRGVPLDSLRGGI